MGIRKGVEALARKNKEIEKRQENRSFIPELFLGDDGDKAIFRFLTDDPIDVDFHEEYDQAANRKFINYCKMEDEGFCDHCELSKTNLRRMFMFWVYVEKILHTFQNQEKSWKEVKIGSRILYEESIGSVMLLKRKFGEKRSFWNQFEKAFENFGTWKDRTYALERSGVRRERDTTYSLTPLDKSPMPSELISVMGSLPPLEAVAKGLVTKLEIGLGTSGSNGKKEETKEKPKVELELPDVEIE